MKQISISLLFLNFLLAYLLQLSVHAQTPTQQIEPSNGVAQTNNEVLIRVNYSTINPAMQDTTGIGLRMYFDSSALDFIKLRV